MLKPISTLTSLGGVFKNVLRKDLLLFYEATKLNTFADGFIKCEKMPLAAICQKLKKGKRTGNPSPPTQLYLPPVPAQTCRW